MNSEMQGVVPMLKAKDLAQTITFYTSVLGFSATNRMDSDGGKPQWCSLQWGGAEVMFYSMDNLDAPPGPPAMTGVLYFRPKDVRALWEHLKERVPVEWELQEMAYGMLEFAIRDCNGYILSFGQELEHTG